MNNSQFAQHENAIATDEGYRRHLLESGLFNPVTSADYLTLLKQYTQFLKTAILLMKDMPTCNTRCKSPFYDGVKSYAENLAVRRLDAFASGKLTSGRVPDDIRKLQDTFTSEMERTTGGPITIYDQLRDFADEVDEFLLAQDKTEYRKKFSEFLVARANLDKLTARPRERGGARRKSRKIRRVRY